MCRSQFCVYLVANADRMAQICLISCTPLYRGGTGIVITHVCVWVCLCCPSVHMTIHECVDGCQPNLVHMGNLGKGWQKFRMGGVKIEAPRGWGGAWGGGVSSPEKNLHFCIKITRLWCTLTPFWSNCITGWKWTTMHKMVHFAMLQTTKYYFLRWRKSIACHAYLSQQFGTT